MQNLFSRSAPARRSLLRTGAVAAVALAALSVTVLGSQPAAADADKVFTLKYQNSYPPSLAFYNKNGVGFRELVERWSHGRIKFENYEAGALASVSGQLEAVSLGIIDVSQSWGGFYVGDVPEANVEIGLPTAWQESWETYDAYYNRGLKEVVAEAYESRFNVKHFPAIIGMQYVISTTRDINSLADMKGMKLRALGVYGEFVQALGASATVIPGAELYTALQLGTADGLIYGAEAVVAQGLQEFTKATVISPNLNAGAGHWLFNRDVWNSLPADLQQVIEDAAKYGNALQSMNYRVVEAASVGTLIHDGVHMVSLSPEDRETVSKVASELWETVASRSPLAAKAVQIVRDQQHAYGRMK